MHSLAFSILPLSLPTGSTGGRQEDGLSIAKFNSFQQEDQFHAIEITVTLIGTVRIFVDLNVMKQQKLAHCEGMSLSQSLGMLAIGSDSPKSHRMNFPIQR